MAGTGDLNTMLQQAQQALQLGRLNDAKRQLQKLRKLAPRQPAVHFLLSRLARAEGNPASAVHHLRNASQLAPADAGLLAELASALDDAGKPGEALAAYAKALELDPALLEAAVDRAVLEARHGNRASGLKDLRQICAANTHHARAWRNLAMLEREALNTGEASKAAEHALQIAPGDPRALYLRALAAFDAGEPSATLFEEARRADPSNSAILLKQAAALLAEEDAQGAENLLLSAVQSAPGWVEAHRTLAQIRWEGGLPGRPTASLENAVQREPDNAALWLEYTRLADRFGGEAEALAALEQAERALGSHQDLDFIRAQVLTESSRFAEIGDLVARLAKRPDPAAQLLACRWYGRMHDFKPLALRAKSLVDQGFGGDAWPYLAMAWRGLGDSRWDWLERGGDLVRTFDLAGAGIDIARTAEVLRELHKTRRPPLEQSLRGGTQTDGMLFANTAPEIMQLRDAITTAVEDYVANLPEPDPRHPLLGRPRGQFRFTGAWSVRLTGGGFHVSHIHNEGDISSACYIVMPELDGEEERDAGCLVVGEPPREFGLDWAPLKTVRPVPGRLALFPSWAWHGTRSFAQGERMTVAFDVKLDG